MKSSLSGSRSDDGPVEEIDLVRQLRHLDGTRTEVLAALQEIQHRYGYLPEAALEYVAAEFDAPLADVLGLATFYDQFALTPRGDHTIRVCTGTACHVNDSLPILETLEQEIDIRPGEVTDDGAVTLAEVRCVGACSLAPVVQRDDDTYGEMDAESAVALLEDLR